MPLKPVLILMYNLSQREVVGSQAILKVTFALMCNLKGCTTSQAIVLISDCMPVSVSSAIVIQCV